MARHDRRTTVAVLAVLFIASACQASPTPIVRTPSPAPTPSPTETPSPAPPLDEIGPPEGELDILVRPGYAERGDNDSAYDWVTPFEDDSGCQVNAVEIGTPDQMLARVRTDGPGAWDGLAASGVISRRLIAEAAVRPIDVDLFAAWHDLWPPLQGPAHDTVAGEHYGIAQGWAANLLMWNTDEVTSVPPTWRVLFDPEEAIAGGATAYDSAIAMADVALYLSVSAPDLGIDDPYELTLAQLDAVTNLLRAQRPLVTSYWGTPFDQIGAFEQGDAVVGAAWPGQVRFLQSQDPPVPVEAVVPVEGVTGWADTWMVLTGARHPNCMLRWIAWMISPQVQKQVAEYVAEAPANLAACAALSDHPGPFGFEGFCDAYHADDPALAGRIHFWKTPLSECGDARGDGCVDYAVWQQRWDEIKASG